MENACTQDYRSSIDIMLAATIAVVTSAHAASDADREMMRVYADAMTNAIPTLAKVQEETEKDCSSVSGPSGASSCVHGLDLDAAGVRTVRSRMSSLKVPGCLRGVDAQLRVALDAGSVKCQFTLTWEKGISRARQVSRF